MGWLLACALALSAPPSEHTVLYYNARMALRQGDPLEAAQLWLVRNTLEDQTETVSPHDADFHSVTWAALGEMGVCADGLKPDEDGAGLWPLALHNWVVRNMSRRSVPQPPRPFDAFDLGRQQRFVAIGDVLSLNQIQNARLSRGRCYRHLIPMARSGQWPLSALYDRKVAARLLHELLRRSRETLAGERVRGEAVIAARLFDVNLQLVALAAREARQRTGREIQLGRQLGFTVPSLQEISLTAPITTLDKDSESATILRECVHWPTEEWMAIEAERRRFLFHHALLAGEHLEALDETALAIIDTLIDRGDGAGVEAWIALRGEQADGSLRPAIWSGERGAQLLALSDESGFRERAVIALHRGVSHLEQGELPSALRAMAYAMRYAPESRRSELVQNLSRRWVSYIAARFEITDDLLAMLQELVPRRAYNTILEDLLWRSAFHADQASFTRGVQAQRGSGALERRLALLAPLASGDVGRFSRQLRSRLAASPSEVLRFLDQLVQRLEREDAGVRAMHRLTLTQIRVVLTPLASDDAGVGRQSRSATALMERTQAILEGLGGLGLDASDRDRARALDPTGEVFAGSVRLAPGDPLPWPFSSAAPSAPSVFTPIQLVPREWTGADGALVFGWSIEG
jgi:hypothetical protein